MLLFFISSFLPAISQSYQDTPFIQDYAEKFALTSQENVSLLQVKSDRNKVVNILSSDGLLQPFEKKLRPDIRFRPLTDMKLIAFTTYQDQFVYLTDKAVVSNAWAGTFYFDHGIENPSQFAIGSNFETLITSNNGLTFFQNKTKTWEQVIDQLKPQEVIYDGKNERYFILTSKELFQFQPREKELTKVYTGESLTALTLFNDKIVVGSMNGLVELDASSFQAGSLNQKLPWTEITSLKTIHNELWIGSTKGAFKLRSDGKYDYYASKRWLVDDHIVDMAEGPDQSVLLLSQTGLSKIHFVEMTLAEKAEHFQEIQRLRHVRYGFSSEIRLEEPGDLSTAVLRDTDNDGLWTSMYLAGELFRYAVTKSEDAKQNAYEAFEAMERLTAISGIHGFPARTYEIDEYQSSDNDPDMPEEKKIWRKADQEDIRWRWKSTTSSDESCGHFFVYALFAEIAPDQEWRDRAIHQIKIQMDHIMENDWYLVTWNGQPTQWGRTPV
ncbi:MAG: hypothetical protein KDD63_16540, partial [Bacteroidetes bacterium]|nr:hypothetical protein [Bacteroidota bacterium]